MSRVTAPNASACGCEWCSHFVPRISVSTPFGVEDGRWGFDPAIQGVPMGNLSPARRGRDKYLAGAR